MEKITATVDASGLNCPMPILRTKQAIEKLKAGDVLKVISTDAGSVRDFDSFCVQTGNELKSVEEKDGKFHFLINVL
jgi:tRNA 2-thiouridine synthesizing protein A